MAETEEPERLEAGAGRILRDAREREGLSQQDAALGLNLNVGIIEALEADRYDMLPPRTFVRGYLRAYAKLVDVQEASVLAAFEKQWPEPEQGRVQAATSGVDTVAVGGWLKWLALLIVLALLGYVAYENYRQPPDERPLVDEATESVVDESAPPPSTATQTQPAPTEQVSPLPDSIGESDFDSETELDSDVASVDASEQPEASSDELDDVMPESVETQSEDAMAAESPAAVAGTLEIDIPDESWVEITDAHGTSLHAGLVQGPQVLRVNGEPPFQLVIGNADKVSLQYDGEPVALQEHSHRNVARLTVPLSP